MRRVLVLCLLACQPQPTPSPDDEPIARAAVQQALDRLDTMRVQHPYPTRLEQLGITLDSLTTGRLELGDTDGQVTVTRGTTTCTARQAHGVVVCEAAALRGRPE